MMDIGPWDTPFGVPPFDRIAEADLAQGFEAALAQSRAAVAAVAATAAPADFENTVLALEHVAAPLERWGAVFWTLTGSCSTPAIEALGREVAPRLAGFRSEVTQNPALFARLDAVHAARDGLDEDQRMVVEKHHRAFVRAGAALDDAGKARLAEINARLASLGTAFGQAVLQDERSWRMDLSPETLASLPADLAAACADGLTTSRSVIEPFLAACPDRALRETAWRAWTDRGARGGDSDTGAIMAETLALRHEQARLLGFASFAEMRLTPEMAGTPERVEALLDAVWAPALAKAEAEAAPLRDLAAADGIELAPWDWRFYAAKRAAEALDLGALRPHFPLEAMIAATFDVAARLFGLSFREIEVPRHHPDARAWEVTKDGHHLAVFIADHFARPEKRSGAWCASLRQAETGVRPIVLNVCNFAKPAHGAPALLTLDDARTLFHEFGHALHHLLTEARYPSISGTSVARDFVELPSQLYEHWLTVPEVLDRFARHVETGEALPPDVRDGIKAAEQAGQGFATVEYLASAIVDLDLHRGPPPADVRTAEAQTLSRIGLPAAIAPRHAVSHFLHVFAGSGYAAGYYSYLWSEVMDADAFAAFEAAGDAFDPALAAALAALLAAGGGQSPEALYRTFRGALPGPEALLRDRGLAA